MYLQCVTYNALLHPLLHEIKGRDTIGVNGMQFSLYMQIFKECNFADEYLDTTCVTEF